MNIEVRKATLEDLPRVYEIELLSFKDPYPFGYLKALYYLSPIFLVATLNNEVVGYIIAMLKWGSLGHIISLAVHPHHRRKGIGKLLLNKTLNLLKGLGALTCRLEVREDNEPAISLYRSLGFLEDHRIKGYYKDGTTAIVMIKKLS
ncbi:MAG: ribosomal-protein-alanine N-acetyltransferase [Candidatus Methanomethylicota archaeon]|uniref:Ribosomal-protein-alanine N-acetyltransferase n=1 Tax=Thermoproteota archaeon TaxID=2056631 RepID=A0A497EUZ7_9CREN|nr:MAG: ribosomal-protein-alanine N-acetyltransferase [Candidatus Verstraetearchaeota archaeon]